jgi:DNA polymerase (family 10)
LLQLAALAFIRGDLAEETLFKRAAELIRSQRIESDSDLSPIFETPPAGLDPEILKRLRQMYEAGGWVLLESTLADIPADLRWLIESGTITIEQIAAVHRALDVTSAADVAAAIQEQMLRRVAGIGEIVEGAVAEALPGIRASIPRIPLGRATTIAEPLLLRLRSLPGLAWAEPAGSLRRGQDMIGDIEVIASLADAAGVIDHMLALPDVSRALHRSERRLYILVERVQVGLRFPEPPNAGAALLYLTGSAPHFSALQAHADAAGFRLKPSGLHTRDGVLRPAAHEDDIYRALGLPTIPPEIRNGDEEVAMAARGELPALVTRADIRGDLHMHSTWSDGRDSVEAMVAACRALGYEYMAITDHSPTSAATRNLTIDAVKRQAEEIEALRERYPEIAILHGCEADILSDGRLDFPDRVLERFDIVLASLHESYGQGRDQLLKRYLGAVRHPLVAMITHPTNRLVPHRAGYELDYDRLFEAAAETHTIVEIDGSPSHLDLDGPMARRAIAAGAEVAVDSDCHRAEMLERQMQLGILTARRGWVEPRHVLNTRPLADVRAAIARKRAGH